MLEPWEIILLRAFSSVVASEPLIHDFCSDDILCVLPPGHYGTVQIPTATTCFPAATIRVLPLGPGGRLEALWNGWDRVPTAALCYLACKSALSGYYVNSTSVKPGFQFIGAVYIPLHVIGIDSLVLYRLVLEDLRGERGKREC